MKRVGVEAPDPPCRPKLHPPSNAAALGHPTRGVDIGHARREAAQRRVQQELGRRRRPTAPMLRTLLLPTHRPPVLLTQVLLQEECQLEREEHGWAVLLLRHIVDLPPVRNTGEIGEICSAFPAAAEAQDGGRDQAMPQLRSCKGKKGPCAILRRRKTPDSKRCLQQTSNHLPTMHSGSDRQKERGSSGGGEREESDENPTSSCTGYKQPDHR
ncbi:hypothetical protein NDU88_005384 [Pleurodeles waltl]|uniref:Uncharacterized protein n=1 Tax=Pleurodeles waltl TaxID=8319 RepID=A0AAV7QER8_PLEWA|nr:hypothetical protein NDU88_005384 [Pleurodeles waltl]